MLRHIRILATLVCTLAALLAAAACDLAPGPTAPTQTPVAFKGAALTSTSTVAATVTLAAATLTPMATSTPEPPAPSPTLTPREVTATPSARVIAPSPSPARGEPAAAANTPVPATSTPPASAAPRIEVLAQGFGSPDDLWVTASGDIIFGDFGNKALNVLRAGQTSPVVLAAGLNEPEGIVVTRGGMVVVAEQGTNRLLEVNPSTGEKRLLRQMENTTGKDGIDGLGLDPATGDILVPDSPNGTLLRLSADGQRVGVIATGFVRPTGAAVEPDGTIVVADEFGNAVYRLLVGGGRHKIASIYQPDDVVVGPDGSIYVNSLGGDIARIDPKTGRLSTLASGLKLPHGLGVDPSGRVIVAEAGRNRIIAITPASP